MTQPLWLLAGYVDGGGVGAGIGADWGRLGVESGWTTTGGGGLGLRSYRMRSTGSRRVGVADFRV